MSFPRMQAFFAGMPMARLLQPLLLYLSIASDRELARQVQFLMEQNRILREKLPNRITVTPQQRRRLLKFGRGLKRPVIRELLSVVTPRTFARWVNEERRAKSKMPPEPRKPGR